MASWNSPAVARRWLAYELRRLREDKGLAQRDVGKACGWSGVKVSYLENAQQNVADDDLDKLLPLYEVPEGDRPDFYAAGEASRQKGWWERYGEDVVPPFFGEFIGLEQGASLIRTFEPMIVPGLLQIRDYMVHAISAGLARRTDRVISQIIEVRTARQEVLTRATNPARLVAVVDESVVRRVVGGPQVMAAQMRHILDLCRRENVELYVVPFEHGITPGMNAASQRILHFARSEPAIVYMEASEGAQWIEDQAEVDQNDLAFGELVHAALTLDDSLAMIRDAEESYARRARIV
jgi:transcriptional regulator with XRE-family HTH domain